MPRETIPGDRWLSFHLHLDGGPAGLEGFLTRALPDFLAAESRQRSFRRFFFLRYSEGGLHLRLRFRLEDGRPNGGLGSRLENFVAGHLERAPGAGFRLEVQPYDRTAHYFGETRESVYAELLNEASSQLALRLLASLAGQGRLRRWLVSTAVLDLLVDFLAAGDPSAKRRFLARSRDFAAQTAEALFGDEARAALAANRATVRPSAAPLPDVRSRLEPQLRLDRGFRRLAALLRRAHESGGRGPFVSVHALHLLCNKLGASLIEEHAAYLVLLHLTRTRRSAR